MAKPLLAVDICNTLCDVNSILQKQLGPNPASFSIPHPQITLEFFRNNLWIFKVAEPLPGAVEGLRYIAKHCNIVYLSARPEWSRQITLDWLKKWGFPDSRLILTQDKLAKAVALGVCAAIDDAPHEIKSLHRYCPVYVPAQPYNRNYENRFEWADMSTLQILQINQER